MITKLLDKWRRLNDKFEGRWSAHRCAKELETSLPVWTKITDISQLEPDGYYFCTWKVGDNKWLHSGYETGSIEAIISIVGSIFCRPLCDLDYPPEQDNATSQK